MRFVPHPLSHANVSFALSTRQSSVDVDSTTDGERILKTRRRQGVFMLAGAVLLAGAGGLMAWHARRTIDWNDISSGQRFMTWPRSPWKNSRPEVRYVGNEACARCHAEIYESFSRHPMGRSLTTVGAEPAATTGTRQIAAFDAGSLHFTIERRAGRLVHREWSSDEHGRILAEVEAEVAYALGSGTRGISYLVERAGRLYQSPISWYAQKQRWDLSPGYEGKNQHFDRPIEPWCVFCHANQAVPVPMTVNRYEEPIFRGLAIGCERCHGPGELHTHGQEIVDGKDLTIVNPKHLEPSLRAEVCEQCHLLGDHRVPRSGRGIFDFRPGLSTFDFYAVFERTAKGKAKAVGQVEQMKLSRCYQESQGRLGCTSCHDPHQTPANGEKVGYYRGKCLQCHEQQGCSLPVSTRLARSRDDDCVHCHLPARAGKDIVHVATTDHRILRDSESQTVEPAPAATFDLPLRLVNNDHRGSGPMNSPDRELGIATALEGGGYPNTPAGKELGLRALKLLDSALAERPDDLEVQRVRARALILTGQRRAAVELEQRILKSAPNYEQVLEDLIQYAVELRDPRRAFAAAATAVALNPSSSDLHERQAYLFCQAQNWTEALRESRESLRLNPFRRFARMFVVEALLHLYDGAVAEAELGILQRLFPDQRESLERWFAEKRGSLPH